MKRFSFVLLVFLPFIAICGQDNDWTNFTNGHTVIDMVKDSNIFWIATTGGIVKYDIETSSKTFYTKSNSGLSTYSISTIATDKNHNLWIGTNGYGLCKFDGSKWNYSPYNISLPTNYISDIFVDNVGNIWVGCSCWYEQTFPHQTLHFGGLLKFDGKNWMNLTSNLSSNSQDKSVFTIKCDQNNNVFISDGSLVVFDGIDWSYNYPNNNSNNRVIRFTIDNQNHVWLVQDQTKLVEFDGINWRNYSIPVQITQDILYSLSIYSDSFNNIWMGWDGINDFGLLKFNGTNWTNYNTSNSEIETNQITSISSFNDLLCIGTKGKEIITVKDTDTWSKITTSNSALTSNDIRVVYSDSSGSILTSTTDSFDGQNGNSSLIKYDGANWEIIDKIPIAFVKEIVIDHSGNYWIAGINGVVKYDGDKSLVFNKENTSFPSNNISSIAIDSDNNIWIVGGRYGEQKFTAKYDGSYWSVHNCSLSNEEFYKIVIDKKNNKWIAGYDGLLKFDGKNWELFNAINGNSDFNRVVYDLNYNSTKNILWLATSKGLVRYDFVNFLTITDEGIQSCGIDKNNNIWITTNNSLLCFENDGSKLDSITSNFVPSANTISITNNGYVFLATETDGLIVYSKGNFASLPVLQNTFSENLDLFPNPCSNYFTINHNLTGRKYELKIFNTLGQLVKKSILLGNKSFIDISDLNNGVYIVQFSNQLKTQRGRISKE